MWGSGIVAGAQYDVYAWMCGEIDAEDSGGGGWGIQVAYYPTRLPVTGLFSVRFGTAVSGFFLG